MHRLRRLLRLTLLGLLLGCGAVAWLGAAPAPAGADVVWGCPPLIDDAGGDLSEPLWYISGDIRWAFDENGDGVVNPDSPDPGDVAGIQYYGSNIDFDGDGTTDMVTEGWLATLWQAWDALFTHSYIPQVLDARLGLDYAQFRADHPLDFWSYQQQHVRLRTWVQDSASYVPAPGQMTFNLTLHRTNGKTDEVNFVYDTTGAATPEGEAGWPTFMQTSVFLDTKYAAVAGIGVRMQEADGTVAPRSNAKVTADIETMAGNPLGLELTTGYEGTYSTDAGGTPTQIGAPGDWAAAVSFDCAETAPRNLVAVAYDPAAAAGLTPAKETFSFENKRDTDGDGTPEHATTYADLALAPPPQAVDVLFAAENADVDGDGVEDGADVNDDGVLDLPVSVLELHHTPETAPQVDAVYASNPLPGADYGPLHVAVDAAAAAPCVRFRSTGTPKAYDSNGDGTLDKAGTKLRRAELAFRGLTDDTLACTDESVSSGEARVHYANSVTDADGNGLADPLGATDDPVEVPADVAATAQEHFAPATERFVRIARDAATATYSVGGHVDAVSDFAYDNTVDPTVSVRSLEAAPLALEAALTDDAGTTTDIWGAFATLPTDAAVSFDLSGTETDGDPLRIGWQASARTGAAVAVAVPPRGDTSREYRVAGWVGTGDGSTDGLAPETSVTVETGDGAGAVTLDAGAPAALDAGVTTSTQAERDAGFLLLARVAATVPTGLSLNWTTDDEGALKAVNGAVCDACSPLDDLRVAATRDAAGAHPSGSALDLDFDDAFAATPSDVAATQAEHFTPAPANWVEYAADATADTWSAYGRLSGVRGFGFDATADPRVTLSSAGLDQLGIAAEMKDAEGSGTDVWAVLEDVPDSVDLTADLKGAGDDGDPVAVDWANSAATSAAMALQQTTPSPYDELRVAGWAGGGGAPGLAPHTTVVADLAESGSTLGASADAATALDVGLSQWAAGKGTLFLARLGTRFQGSLTAAWETDPATGALVKASGSACEGCTVEEIRTVAGRDPLYVHPVRSGLLLVQDTAFTDAPPYVMADAGEHFTPAPESWLEYESDPDAGTWQARGRLAGLHAFSYDTSGAPHVVVDTTGTGRLGLAADLAPAAGGETSLWAVLADLPDHVDVTADLESTEEDGDPVEVTWSLSESTPGAFDVAAESPVNPYRHMRAAGWIGSTVGHGPGLPTSATLTLATGDTSTLTYAGSASTYLEAALTTSALADRLQGRQSAVHAAALIPGEMSATWTVTPGTGALERAEIGTCDSCGALSAVDAVAAGERNAAADADFAAPPLDEPFDASFPGAPADVAATAGEHFTPAPPHYAEYSANEADGTWTLAGRVAGIDAFTYDVGGDDTVVVENTGIHQFGLAAEVLAADGYKSSLWSVLAEIPDTATIEVDATEDDGDPIRASWDLAGRTGAAVAFDGRESAASASTRRLHAAGWLGHGDGTVTGIPGQATLTASLAEDGDSVRLDADESVFAAVGVTTSTADDRALGLRTRIRAEADVPEALQAYWRTGSSADGGTTLERAELTTCKTEHSVIEVASGSGLPLPLLILVPTAVCAPVEDVSLTAVTDAGDPDEAALPGVAMLGVTDPTPADVTDDPFRADEGSDFTPRDDYLHAVLMATPADEQTGGSGGSGGSGGGQTSGASGDPGTRTWGVDTRLARLDTLALDRTGGWATAYAATDLCLAADASGSDFGLGLYSEGDAKGLWVNGTLGTVGVERTLDLQAEVDTPGRGGVGDLDTDQRLLAPWYPLAKVVRQGCPDLGDDHEVDPAPGNTDGLQNRDTAWLTGQVRAGTRATATRLLDDLEPGPVLVPVTKGVAATLYSGEAAAADAALRVSVRRWVQVGQPLLLTCGAGGNQDPATCATEDQRIYDQTFWTEAGLDLASDTDAFGWTDLWYLSDDADTADTKTRRVHAWLDTLPANVSFTGRLERRARDNTFDVDATISNTAGADLQPVRIEYWDDVSPARTGDDSEAPETYNLVANYRVALADLGGSVHVHGAGLMPSWGWKPPAYERNDSMCGGPYWNDVVNPDWIADWPENNLDPTTWRTEGPRTTGRSMYVHADLDLNGAGEVELLYAGRKDLPGHDDPDGAADRFTPTFDKYYGSQRLLLESDARVDGEINALVPRMQKKVNSLEDYGVTVPGVQACVDADVPLQIELTQTGLLAAALDGTTVTVTMDRDDVESHGADAAVAVRETYSTGAGYATADGIWAEELLTRVNVGAYEAFTRVQGMRKPVGIIDVEDPLGDAGHVPQTEISMSTMRGGGWASHSADADHHYGWFGIDTLLTEDVENNWTADIPAGGGREDLWNAIWHSGRTLGLTGGYDWSVPAVLDYAGAAGGAWTFTTAESCADDDAKDESFPLSGAELDDGTWWQLSTLNTGDGEDGDARIEAYLVGRWPSGQVRFIRQLRDRTFASGCQRLRFKLSASVTDQGMLYLGFKMQRSTGAGYTTTDNKSMVFDASGNGAAVTSTTSMAVTRSASDPMTVTFSTGETVPSGGICRWYPGDGEVLDQTANPSEITYTYTVPGTYEPMQVCYADDTPGDPEAVLDEELFATTAVVVEKDGVAVG